MKRDKEGTTSLSRQVKEVKFLGRHLMLKGRYVDAILEGRKKATIRKGLVKVKYEELIVHGAGRPVAKVRVRDVIYKRLSELTDDDAKLDGFKSKEELLRELERTYGRLRPDDVVTIIIFDVVQDLTKLEPSDPYLGLSPSDIARLALRYLDNISEEERTVLLELTRTNSIRAAALRLYGDISKRWKVRRVVRRAVKALLEKGVIRGKE